MAIKDTCRFGAFFPTPNAQLGIWSRLQTVQDWEARYNGRMEVINDFRKAGYGHISGSSGHLGTALPQLKSTGIQGRVHCMSWEWAAGDTLRTAPYRPVDILTGQHDAYIISWAEALRDWGVPYYIRLNHEMNSNWYGWAMDPACYRDSWQRIHGLFQQVGATNVKWYWCTNGGDVPNSWNKQEAYYPGHDYVDVVGFDQYNAYTGWHTFSSLIQTPYDRMRAIAPSKKIWIGETGCPEPWDVPGAVAAGKSKVEWYDEMFNATGFDELEMILMFDTRGGFNWRLDTTTASRDKFRQMFEASALRQPPPPIEVA